MENVENGCFFRYNRRKIEELAQRSSSTITSYLKISQMLLSKHTLRHSFARHLLENGYDIRTIQELLGYQNLQTTMIYSHVASKNVLGVRSPLDK